ncbi:MAG: cobyrinate a,c-diamide synthase [Pleurocapsa sp.]
MAVIIAGDRSGVGKTTITLAILAFLARQGNKVQSFKVGPDYIDPMFHTVITNRPCRNLDPVLTSENYVRECFLRHSQNVDWVIVEGVMGLFDGITHFDASQSTSQLNDYASTAHIARLLNLPVLLVLDCSRLSSSVAAIAYGYANLDPQVKIAGVILNQVASDRHLELLENALTTVNLPIIGVLRRNSEVTIPDRHLGLVPTDELSQLDNIFARLAHLAKTSFNWQLLFPLLQPSKINHGQEAIESPPSKIKIAVARDRAFNFYYQDNLDILQQLGAELIFWSPLVDEKLPSDIAGLYFGGGFPEMFAPQLSANTLLLRQLKQLINAEMPTYAECGGLMYLCDRLIDLEEQTWSMVGVIPTTAVMTPKLTLGYRQANALQNSSLIAAGQTVQGHEFHRSQLASLPTKSLWQMQGFHSSSPVIFEGWKLRQLHASYLHLHFGKYRFLAEQFILTTTNRRN